MQRITESASPYRHLDEQSSEQLLYWINDEDRKVPKLIRPLIPHIADLVDKITDRIWAGGRLFYIGAGTSGRLGIVDASECPPTFGVPHGLIVGLIAGGDRAIRKAVEFAEDDPVQGWKDLKAHGINFHDSLIGIAASGTTPYVVGALEHARKEGILTACITNNPDTPLAAASDIPIEIITGPEFVTGSTRMKAGTSQKLILNMISTALMIRLGRVQDNKMVDMQLSNMKLLERGIRMVAEELKIDKEKAKALLTSHGSVRQAILAGKKDANASNK